MKISFIIATYNGEQFLEKTVHSALEQEEIEKEILIIDDGSSDKSYAIAQRLENEYSCIKSYKNDTNRGFCKTVNRGIGLSSGEFVIILDQDDLLEKSHCKKMISMITTDVVMVFCDYYLINEKDEIFEKKDHCRHFEVFTRDFISGNQIPVPGLLIKKSVLNEIGGYPIDERFPNYGEYCTWIRMSEYGRIVFCQQTRALYRRHSTNMTNNFTDKKTIRTLRTYNIFCKKQLLKSKKISLCSKLILLFRIVGATIKNQRKV